MLNEKNTIIFIIIIIIITIVITVIITIWVSRLLVEGKTVIQNSPNLSSSPFRASFRCWILGCNNADSSLWLLISICIRPLKVNLLWKRIIRVTRDRI